MRFCAVWCVLCRSIHHIDQNQFELKCLKFAVQYLVTYTLSEVYLCLVVKVTTASSVKMLSCWTLVQGCRGSGRFCRQIAGPSGLYFRDRRAHSIQTHAVHSDYSRTDPFIGLYYVTQPSQQPLLLSDDQFSFQTASSASVSADVALQHIHFTLHPLITKLL